MSEFFVGQRVVCVDDSIHLEWDCPGRRYYNGNDQLNGLRSGGIYTVRKVPSKHPDGSWDNLKIAEIVRSPDDPFAMDRFQPLPFRSESIFRQIARDVSEGKTVELVT